MMNKISALVCLLVVAGIASTGCTTQYSSNSTINSYVTQVQTTPTLEPTFNAVHIGASSAKPVPTVGPSATKIHDPVEGTWLMKNGPYDCTADFLQDGRGLIRCNAIVGSGTKSFVWSLNQTNCYYVGLSDGTGSTSDAFVLPDGKLVSSILPQGSYLVKVS